MLVTMSDKELSRINVIQSAVEKRMRRSDVAHQLALTERQTQRRMNRFSESGVADLANLRRGRLGSRVTLIRIDGDNFYGPFNTAQYCEKLSFRLRRSVNPVCELTGMCQIR
ncbi:hypothetical protein SB00175_05011 [Klebsiella oxytoca]|nr:Sea24 [Klebsiella oxytoca]VGP57968.1 hypothetical protein SB00175_05011 [Klebsiella oxytoca]